MEAKVKLFPLNSSPYSKELEIAKKEAEKSRHKIRHGALIVGQKREIYVTGSNSLQNSLWRFWIGYSRRYPDRMLHAEWEALSKIPRRDVLRILKLEPIDFLRNATIITYRLSKTGVTGVSRPCPKICWPALKALGFKDAVYIIRYNNELMVAHEYF